MIANELKKQDAYTTEQTPLSVTTIKTHANSALKKLKANDIAHAVTLAKRAGLITGPKPIEFRRLEPREIEVGKLIREGLTNQKISKKMYISVNTVKSHISMLYFKIGAKNRAHAAAILEVSGL